MVDGSIDRSRVTCTLYDVVERGIIVLLIPLDSPARWLPGPHNDDHRVANSANLTGQRITERGSVGGGASSTSYPGLE